MIVFNADCSFSFEYYMVTFKFYFVFVRVSVLCLQANYECFCDAGWTKSPNSPMCNVDVDECHAQTRPPCSTNPPVQCINTPGSFTCGPCPQGLKSDCRGIN